MVAGTARLMDKPSLQEGLFATSQQSRVLRQLRDTHSEGRRTEKLNVRCSLPDQGCKIPFERMEPVGERTLEKKASLLELDRQRKSVLSREKRRLSQRCYRRNSNFKGEEENAVLLLTSSGVPSSVNRTKWMQRRRNSMQINSIHTPRSGFEGRIVADSAKPVAHPREVPTEDNHSPPSVGGTTEAATADWPQRSLASAAFQKDAKNVVWCASVEEEKRKEQLHIGWNEFSAQSHKAEVSNAVLEAPLEPTARVSLIRRLWKHLEQRRGESIPAAATSGTAKISNVSTESNWMLVNGRWVVRDRCSTARASSPPLAVSRQPSEHLRSKSSSGSRATSSISISPASESREDRLRLEAGPPSTPTPSVEASEGARKAWRHQEKLRPREHMALWGRTLSVAATRLRASQRFTTTKMPYALFSLRHGRGVQYLHGEASSESSPNRKQRSIADVQLVIDRPFGASVKPAAGLAEVVSRGAVSSRTPHSIDSTHSYTAEASRSSGLDAPRLNSRDALRTESDEPPRSNNRNAPCSNSADASRPNNRDTSRSLNAETVSPKGVETPTAFPSEARQKVSSPIAAASSYGGISSLKTLSLHQVTESRLPPPTLRLSTKRSNPTIRERYCPAAVSPSSKQQVFWETHTDGGRRLTQSSDSIRFSAFSVPGRHCSKTRLRRAGIEDTDTTQNSTGGMSQFSFARFRFKQFFKRNGLFDIGRRALSRDVLEVNDVLTPRMGPGKSSLWSVASWDDEAEHDESDSGNDEEPTPRVGYKFSASSTPKGPIGPRSVLKRYTPSTHLPECEGQKGELLRHELFVARRRVLALRREKLFYGLFRTFHGPVKIRCSNKKTENKKKTEREGSSARLTDTESSLAEEQTTKPFLTLSIPGDVCAVSTDCLFPTIIYHDAHAASLESPIAALSFQRIPSTERASSWCSNGSGSSVFTVKADELVDDISNEAVLFESSDRDDQSSTFASYFFPSWPPFTFSSPHAATRAASPLESQSPEDCVLSPIDLLAKALLIDSEGHQLTSYMQLKGGVGERSAVQADSSQAASLSSSPTASKNRVPSSSSTAGLFGFASAWNRLVTKSRGSSFTRHLQSGQFLDALDHAIQPSAGAGCLYPARLGDDELADRHSDGVETESREEAFRKPVAIGPGSTQGIKEGTDAVRQDVDGEGQEYDNESSDCGSGYFSCKGAADRLAGLPPIALVDYFL